jgi:cell division protein FtsN
MVNLNNMDGKRPGRQTGGTLLGIIIGLIVGLGIALGVAVTITKSSLPFLSKPVRSEKAAELTPGQATDPNKPLYGNKEPAKEAAKDFAKPAEAEQSADKKPAQLADKPKNEVKPAETKAAEAKQQPADNKDAPAAAAKSDNPDDKWIYYLQAGAFREQSDAEGTRAKLALSGFEANISERPSESGGPLYRVRLGPFSQLEVMNRIRSKLSDNGIDVAVVRTAK